MLWFLWLVKLLVLVTKIIYTYMSTCATVFFLPGSYYAVIICRCCLTG